MLRTCMGRGGDSSNARNGDHRSSNRRGLTKRPPRQPPPLPPDLEPPSYSASGIVDRSLFDNGDVFGPAKGGKSSLLHHGGHPADTVDVFPEEIPGLPRHRPAEFSPR